MEEFYQRRLPHWHPEDADVFVTWRLYDSYPRQQRILVGPTAGQAFVAMDRELNRASTGPRWLEDERVARAVAETLQYGATQLKLYQLHAWVIMPNHVHILIHPQTDLPRITKSIKAYSARKANEILGRTGEPFWLDESYDHWVRTSEEFTKIVRYIQGNPVVAGLVNNPEDWRWSSAFELAGREACPTKDTHA